MAEYADTTLYTARSVHQKVAQQSPTVRYQENGCTKRRASSRDHRPTRGATRPLGSKAGDKFSLIGHLGVGGASHVAGLACCRAIRLARCAARHGQKLSLVLVRRNLTW